MNNYCGNITIPLGIDIDKGKKTLTPAGWDQLATFPFYRRFLASDFADGFSPFAEDLLIKLSVLVLAASEQRD